MIFAGYQAMSDVDTLSPKDGNIGFGSALYEWGFTLKTFAEMYSCKFSLSERRMRRKLWK